MSEHVCDVVSSMMRKSVELVNNIDADLPIVRGDGNRINQILTNLISNSIKFTESGTITLTAYVDGNFIKTEIADT